MKKLILIFILSISCHLIFGQGNHSVDIVTGTLKVDIPIFSVSVGELDVPGVLQYASDGLKIVNDPGWVGQNWDLSVQAYGIARQMRNLPDDYSGTSPDNRRGWLRNETSLPATIKNFVPSTDNNPGTCTDEAANYTVLNNIGYDLDTEPDVFYVNAPGLSFQFYFDENKVPQVVPYQDVVVAPNTTSGTITSFTVTDDKGIQYKFEELETLTQSVKAVNLYYQVRQSKMHLTPLTYNTGWKLTKMISPVYGTIDFTYSQIGTTDSNLAPDKNKLKYLYPVTFTNTTGANGKLEYNRSYTYKIPLKISSPTKEVQFTTSDGRLNLIDVYDKRDGVLKISKKIAFNYDLYSSRAFLRMIQEQGGQQTLPPKIHSFGYYSVDIPTSIPVHSSTLKDEWGFYKFAPGIGGYVLYNETASRGTLKRVTYPHKGYSVFFYEAHEYKNGTITEQGAGIRVRKIVSFDGVSVNSDIVKEYEYKTASGESSGKLQHLPLFSVAGVRVDKYNTTTGARYRDVQLANPGIATAVLNGYFTVKASGELSNSDLLFGSAVAYERVTEKIRDGGHSVYEYDLSASYGEASANNNEWEASKTLIARPSSGTSSCYETGPVAEGINQYPYPPNPNYGFVRGLLKKVSDFREDGIKRREVAYDYQRIYGGMGIRKIYGLALEELPTYYYSGSAYVDAKMFVYCKYAINTDVKTVLKKTTETFFTSDDLVKKSETSKEYFYGTTNHRNLERIVQFNSDNMQSATRFKYVKDYVISTPADAQTTALKNLQTTHRTGTMVEMISTKTIGGSEKYIGASLTCFQTISGTVYPNKQYSFASGDGITSFTPATTTGTTFAFDQANYVLVNTLTSFDSYGNPKETVGRDKAVTTTINGYSGSVPIIAIQNAKVQEFVFSDFEATTEVSFSTPWTSGRIVGRHGSKGVLLPTGTSGPYFLVKGVVNESTQGYIFSCWLKASTAGTIAIKLSGNVTATTSLSFDVSNSWKYYAVSVPVPLTMTGTGFSVEVRTSAAVQIDDAAFYPSQAAFKTLTYLFPFGPTIETDSQGNTSYTTYDDFGRVKLVYDRDGNIVNKYDYQLKP